VSSHHCPLPCAVSTPATPPAPPTAAALLRRLARPVLPAALALFAVTVLSVPTARADESPPPAAHAATAATVVSDLHRELAPTGRNRPRAQRQLSRIEPMSATGLRSFGTEVLGEAARHAGSPYVYGATGPGAFDCSGFTRYVYGRLGIALPHNSNAQYAVTRHIPAGQAVPGDLIFVDGLGHVAIYAGGGMMWDAPTAGGQVSRRGIYGSFIVGRVIRGH
jgi:cell wall-associated NlpC family hydrolase